MLLELLLKFSVSQFKAILQDDKKQLRFDNELRPNLTDELKIKEQTWY